jgi:elongation factor G
MSALRRSRIAKTITRTAEVDYTHKKQTGGTGQFARVKIVFERNPDGDDFVFESKVVGGSVPKEYIPGVQKGIQSVHRVPARWPASRCSRVKATLVDGAYHDVDSSGAGVRNRVPRLRSSEAAPEGSAPSCSSRS